MGANDQRISVFPTRMTLTQMKQALVSENKSHSLLKRKSDALSQRFRTVLKEIRDAKLAVGSLVQEATFSLAKASYSAGNISNIIRENIKKATIKINVRIDNVSGVYIPNFQYIQEDTGELELIGLGKGGIEIQKCRKQWIKVIESITKLASLQTSFYLLDDIIRMTNRRVCAIEYIFIPRIENTISYIISELDEQDREEFFRLKKIQEKKNRTDSSDDNSGIKSESSLDFYDIDDHFEELIRHGSESISTNISNESTTIVSPNDTEFKKEDNIKTKVNNMTHKGLIEELEDFSMTSPKTKFTIGSNNEENNNEKDTSWKIF